MTKHRLLLALSLVWCVLLAVTAYAQQETVTIAGTVRDVSGAIVPGATVIVTNVQTNIATRTQAGDDGGYVVPSLRPGESDLRPHRRIPGSDWQSGGSRPRSPGAWNW